MSRKGTKKREENSSYRGRNYVKEQNWGKTAYRRQRKQILTQKNIQDRLRFGETVRKTGYLRDDKRARQKRSHILFTDETWLEVSPKGNTQNQRYYTEDPTKISKILVPKYVIKVMVAGGFCAQGVKKLHMRSGGTVNVAYYKDKILPL